MALPGESATIVPPQRFRLAIGDTYIKDGKLLPRKLDHWSIRRLSVQRGQKPQYVTDEPAQVALCKAAGVKEKPTAIPVALIGNPELVDGKPRLPESIMWARMARYSGGKCVCSCGDFDDAGVGTASERLFEEKTSGSGQYVKKYYVLARTKERECNPEACPWATGDHSEAKYKGTPLCKPQVVLSVGLPWYPVVGTVAKFKTTGWHSYRALRDSILAISLQTNGWLHDIPDLWLVLDWEMAGNGQLVPSVRMEYHGQVQQLREATVAVQGRWVVQSDQLKQLQAGIAEGVVAEEEDPQEQAAHQVEFAPEGVEQRPTVIDAEFEVEGQPEPAEPQGEPLELQPPPPGPSQVTDLATFEAAMAAVGAGNAESLKRFKDELGLNGIKRQDMTVEQLQGVYSRALGEWQAANA